MRKPGDPGNDGKGKRPKVNPVINWHKWTLKDFMIEDDYCVIELIPPETLFRYNENLGDKFYADFFYVEDDDDEEEGHVGSRYRYPDKIRFMDKDGFMVKLYDIEKRKLRKEIFDFINARHDFYFI